MKVASGKANGISGIRFVPLALVFMSIPLFMAFNIKTVALPSGWVFVLFYSWSLISVFLVPVLLIWELAVIASWYFRKPIGRGISVKWHAGATLVGLIAMGVAMWARQLQV